jgi:hypothetical protein
MQTAPQLKWPSKADAEKYFGRHFTGHEGTPTPQWEQHCIVTARLPYPMRLAWQPDKSIHKIRCHRMVRSALLVALEGLWNHFNRDLKAIQEAGADLFGGCYHFALSDDGSLSPHAYGAAFTLDPKGNPAGRKLKDCRITSAIADIFKQGGAQWGGDNIMAPRCAEFSYFHG